MLATHDGPDSGLTAKTEPTEITQTTQLAPSEPQVLPPEEQGVPG